MPDISQSMQSFGAIRLSLDHCHDEVAVQAGPSIASATVCSSADQSDFRCAHRDAMTEDALY